MDAAIVEALKAGRPQAAFETLIGTYRRRVFGLAFSILRDRAAAEDVAQEVFVKLWKALGSYDGRAKLSTWIYAITRNAAISAQRSRRSAGSLSEPAVLAEAEGAHATLDRDASDDERLWRAVTLYDEDGRPVEEVAEMLGMPVNTVKTQLHRARARLAAGIGARREG